MKLLITGARGKVGRATVDAAMAAGHDVTAADLAAPTFERPEPDEPAYVQADVSDAGDAYALLAAFGPFDAVVHSAALPEPTHNPPHTVFQNNLSGVFNLLEGAVRLGVPRFVNVSSETVPGFFFPERPFRPEYLPIDEEHPIRPQDPYALAKSFGEQLCDAAVARTDGLGVISIRPSWVQWEGNYARNLGPQIRDADEPSPGFWAYIDVYDLADALLRAAQSDLPGHEVIYIASPDAASTRTLPELLEHQGIDDVPLRELAQPDAGGISIEKARRLLGYAPKRSWRDYLDERGEPLGVDES